MQHAIKCAVLFDCVKGFCRNELWLEFELFCKYFHREKFTSSNGVIIYVWLNSNKGNFQLLPIWCLEVAWTGSIVNVRMCLSQNWT